MKSFSFNKIPRDLNKKRIKGPLRALKSQHPIVIESQFKVTGDLVKNDVYVTNKLITPNKNNLPSIGQLGEILFDNVTNKFYAWNGVSWTAFDTRETNERVIISDTITIDPNVNNTFLQNSPGAVEWGARISGAMNEQIRNNNLNPGCLNNLDNFVLPVYYSSDVTSIYNADGTVAFSLAAFDNNNHAFVRYSSTGDADLCGCVNGPNCSVRAFGLNDTNSAVFGGNFTSTLFIYNGENVFVKTIVAESSTDCFLLKYNSSNTLDWFSLVTSTGGDNLNGCAINNSQGVIACGVFPGWTLSIYNGNSTSYTILQNIGAGYGMFLSKYGVNGSVEWATKVSSNTIFLNYGSTDINDDGISIVSIKGASSTMVAYHANGVPAGTLSANGFAGLGGLFRYSPTGTFQWAAAIRSKADASIHSVRLNSSGDLIVGGSYQTTVMYIYNSNDSLAFSLPRPETNAGFVAKWNSTGTAEWVSRISGSSGVYYTIADINDLGNVTVTGDYTNSLYIYNSSGVLVSSLPKTGSSDIFIINYDANGDFISAAKVAGVEAENYSMVAINNLGNVVAAGTYQSSPVFAYNSDGGPKISLPIASEGWDDTFIVKWNNTVQLGDPVIDETVKTITYNGPTMAFINTSSSVEGISQTIKLSQYDTVKMVWDAVESTWIVLLNEGELL